MRRQRRKRAENQRLHAADVEQHAEGLDLQNAIVLITKKRFR